jgi:DNA helicase-2/ATP-dependent DNA helicase PcrA
MAQEAENVPGLKDKAIRALRDFSLLIQELTTLRDYSAGEVMRRLLDHTGYRDYLRSGGQKSDERVANVDEIVSAARMFDAGNPGASVLEFVEQISLASPVDRWNENEGAVTLMTLHAAKGLEFPLVFIVGVEEGLLPHARSKENASEIEEERRLLFVGITRAERELYLSHCRSREFRGQRRSTAPSSFLVELPGEVLCIRDLSGSSFETNSASIERTFSPPARSISSVRLTTAAALAGETTPFVPHGDLMAFRPGVVVLHPQYGIGRIVAIEGAGEGRKGRVAFTVGAERTFVLARSPLRPMPGR